MILAQIEAGKPSTRVVSKVMPDERKGEKCEVCQLSVFGPAHTAEAACLSQDKLSNRRWNVFVLMRTLHSEVS